MKYLIDTNVIIGLSKGNPNIEARIRRESPSAIGVSAIVMQELFSGAFKGRRVQANLAAIADLEFEAVAFGGEDARCAGEIRATLAKAGTPIGPYDSLIAGQAMARDLILVTHNTRAFIRVPSLRLEDWEA